MRLKGLCAAIKQASNKADDIIATEAAILDVAPPAADVPEVHLRNAGTGYMKEACGGSVSPRSGGSGTSSAAVNRSTVNIRRTRQNKVTSDRSDAQRTRDAVTLASAMSSRTPPTGSIAKKAAVIDAISGYKVITFGAGNQGMTWAHARAALVLRNDGVAMALRWDESAKILQVSRRCS